jgi:hypothetical protein
MLPATSVSTFVLSAAKALAMSAGIALAVTLAGCGDGTGNAHGTRNVQGTPKLDPARADANPPKVAVAEWPAQKLLYLSGPKPHHIRVLRADHGAFVILQDLALPPGTAISNMRVDGAQRQLQVTTEQGTFTLPVTASGQLVAENARFATANLATFANHQSSHNKYGIESK